VLSGEATNTNIIVFGLTRPGLEPTIYHTRGEHANHYTTDAVEKNVIEDLKVYFFKNVLKIYLCNQCLSPLKFLALFTRGDVCLM
jgi:hypothetical protein